MDNNESLLKMTVLPDGPILVKGSVELTLADGTTVVKENPSICRCGASQNKPYCDGRHLAVGFKG